MWMFLITKRERWKSEKSSAATKIFMRMWSLNNTIRSKCWKIFPLDSWLGTTNYHIFKEIRLEPTKTPKDQENKKMGSRWSHIFGESMLFCASRSFRKRVQCSEELVMSVVFVLTKVNPDSICISRLTQEVWELWRRIIWLWENCRRSSRMSQLQSLKFDLKVPRWAIFLIHIQCILFFQTEEDVARRIAHIRKTGRAYIKSFDTGKRKIYQNSFFNGQPKDWSNIETAVV